MQVTTDQNQSNPAQLTVQHRRDERQPVKWRTRRRTPHPAIVGTKMNGRGKNMAQINMSRR